MRRSSFVSAVAVLAFIASGLAEPSLAAPTHAVPSLAAPSHAVRPDVRQLAEGHKRHGHYTARFTDAAGHPLAGVVVSTESLSDDKSSRNATSGRNGRVELSLPAGRYLIDADGSRATGGTSDATGYVGTERDVDIRSGRTRAAGAIALASGGAVQVHVIDTAGRPAVGVHPELTPVTSYVQPDQDGGFAIFFEFETASDSPRTDARGDATLTGVPLSLAYQICVNPNGSTLGVADGAFLSTCTQSTVLARSGGTVSSTTITVTRRTGATLVGRLRNRAGRGFSRSTVNVVQGENLVASAQTGSDGRFRVGGLRPGTYRVCAQSGPFVQLGHSGYQPGCAAHPVTIEDPTSTASVSVVLQVGAAAGGTITGPHGAPVEGAYVELRRSHGGSAFAETDSRGHFEVKGLPAGHNAVCADTGNVAITRALPYGVRSDCKHTQQRFTATIGHVRTGLRVRLPVGGAATGTVVDRRGRPVPYAEVEADVANKSFSAEEFAIATADAHGHFTLSGLTAGRYRVCADEDPSFVSGFVSGGGTHGCRHKHVTVRTGHLRRHTRIVVPTTSAVRVTAVDEHGRDVAGVDATVIAACHGHFCDSGTTLLPTRRTSVVSTGTTNVHGTVLLTGLRPGNYIVCLFAFYGTTRVGAPSTGYADRCSGSTFAVDVRAGHTVSRRLVLHRGGAVTGRITDADGNPLAGVLVHVAGSAADDLPQSDLGFPGDDGGGGSSALPGSYSTTSADGTYTVRSVVPGDRLVCADPTGATGGSSSSGYLPQCVGGTAGSTTKGDPVRVTGGATTGGVDLALTAGAGIAGHVTSKLRSAETVVIVFRGSRYVAQSGLSRTGAYRIGALSPGTYTVCAASFGPRTQRGRCWDDVAWNPGRTDGPPAGATPVQAVAGAYVSGIDIAVPR